MMQTPFGAAGANVVVLATLLGLLVVLLVYGWLWEARARRSARRTRRPIAHRREAR